MSAAHDARAMSTADEDAPRREDAELPSLTALTAFEATLRQGSFTAAAKELNRTQGAISRQVALLESQIGQSLFHREHPRLRPTRAAEVFGARLRKVLDRLHAAVNDVRQPGDGSGVLHLALLPTFGTTWLIPRLPAFLASHPDVSVDLTTSLRTFDFDDGEIDAAIHYGTGAWRGARSELLMREEVVPVCAPALAAGLRGPQDLPGRTLLQLNSRPRAWTEWFEAMDVADADGRRGPRFEHHMMVFEAAKAGLGVALLPHFAADPLLRDGSLVEPFRGGRWSTRRSYWLVYPERSLELPSLLAFRAWLRAETRAAGAGAE